MPDPDDHRRQLDDALDHVRETLAELLAEEARRSIDGAIKRLDLESRGLRISAQDVIIQLPPFELVSAPATGSRTRSGGGATRRRRPAATKPRAKRAKAAAASGTTRRGRPDGPVKLAVLAAFDAADGASLTAAEVKQRLEAARVPASPDNVHQQLRRLTQAGEIERAGRGVYRRIVPSAAADA